MLRIPGYFPSGEKPRGFITQPLTSPSPVLTVSGSHSEKSQLSQSGSLKCVSCSTAPSLK